MCALFAARSLLLFSLTHVGWLAGWLWLWLHKKETN
jgi:hypothetical protein